MSFRVTLPLLRFTAAGRSLRSRVRAAEAAEAALLAGPSSSSSPSSSTSTTTASEASSSAQSLLSLPIRRDQGQLGRSTIKLLEQGNSHGKYQINRTEGGSLPVYSDFKNDGRCSTIIRKVDGNVAKLQLDLNTYFQTIHIDPLRKAPQCTMRPTTRHLVFKGDYVLQVKSWMELQGW